MRVAVIVRGGLHPSGRVQVVPALLALLGRLAVRHDLHAFAVEHLSAPVSYPLGGFQVHDLGRPTAPFGLGTVARQRALVRALAEYGPFDLVHGFWGDPAGVLAVGAGRQLAIPTVVTCDSGEFVALPEIGYGSARTWRGRRRIGWMCRHAAAVHVCTTFMATLSRTERVTPVVIPIGIEVRPPSPRPPAGPPWHLLQVASLSRVKNQALLIDTLAELGTSRDVRVDLVGEDTLGGAIQRYALERGVGDRVTVHGFKPSDALPAFHGRAHLYVQTSWHEAAGVSVLEAAAAGLPIVGTRRGYLADWPAEAAVTVEPATPQALAHAISALLDTPERRVDLAARARAWTTAHDVEWSAARFDDLYRQVTEHRPRVAVTASSAPAD